MLLIESRRHFLDYADMTAEEASMLGALMKKIYGMLRVHIEAERVYQLSMMEGAPHLHIWLLPRGRDVPERGLKLWQKEVSCEEKDAVELVEKLREAMK